MDEFSYYNSQNEFKNDFIFQNVQHVWIPDQNNSSYPNGQVLFDLASLSNSGKYIDFQQSYIVVPLVVTNVITGSTTVSVDNAFATSLKNGYHQLINSMSVELTNCQVVNLTNFSNLDINYKLLTTCCREDELNFLPSINFSKDTAESFSYNGANSTGGVGECNNTVVQTTFTPVAKAWGTNGWNFNQGRINRMLSTSFDPSNCPIGGVTGLVSASSLKTVSKNYYATSGNTDNVHYVTATIPLKIIHDFFRKMPLTKGAYMRLILNLNTQCQSVLSITGGNYSGYTTTSLNNVFPLMVSPIGGGLVLNSGTSVTVGLGIAKSYNTTTSYSHNLSSCRFYARLCEMTPTAEEMYLSAVPTKMILYNDILSFTTYNQAPNSQISQILTNGVSRPRYLLIIPQLAGAINGSAVGTIGSSWSAGVGSASLGTPMNSPFSSSPGTTAPQGSISNINVLVSGQVIYQSNYLFGFEEYLQEIRGSNALNGGIPLGLSSGLLSQNDWENGYRFTYVDLSRRISQPNDDISRSIQVIFTNASPYVMDFFYIIGFEKSITVSTSTGSLII